MVFSDPPYNVPIVGHVSGLGKVQHREFATASGEMNRDSFAAFLTKVLGHLAAWSVDGALHYGTKLNLVYCDLILKRLHRVTGIEPVHIASGSIFAEIGRQRAGDSEETTAGAATMKSATASRRRPIASRRDRAAISVVPRARSVRAARPRRLRCLFYPL